MKTMPTVIELLHARRQQGSEPGARKDPYKLAIVTEEGSMRWVVAAGMLARLQNHGIMPDLIVGTSGGGLAATYFGAGNTTEGCLVLRHLSSRGYDLDGKRRFIDPKRLLRGKPAMDLDGMANIAFTENVPLNYNAYAQNRTVPTYLTTTTRQGQSLLQPLHGQNAAAVRTAMKNTSRIPIIGHDARDQSVLWDGGLSNGIPIQHALDLGATHVLVIRCKSETTHLKLSRLETCLVAPLLKLQAPDILGLIPHRRAAYAKTLALLAQNQPHICTLTLPKVDIGPAETKEGNLFRQLVKAWHYAGSALSLPEQKLPTVWQPEAALYL